MEGQWNRPRSNLFVNRQASCPSCQTIFMTSPRRPLKINKSPSNGSRFNVSCTRRASPRNPFLMTVWPVAIHPSAIAYRDCSAHTPFGIGIINSPKHRAPGPAHQRPPRHQRQIRFPSPRSISIKPVFFAADRAERDNSSAGTLCSAGVARGAATSTGTKPGAVGSPSSFVLASRRHAKIRLGAIPCLSATADTLAPAADASARVLVLSSWDQWRRCLPFAKNLNPH